jgi:hypothetical protein
MSSPSLQPAFQVLGCLGLSTWLLVSSTFSLASKAKVRKMGLSKKKLLVQADGVNPVINFLKLTHAAIPKSIIKAN